MQRHLLLLALPVLLIACSKEPVAPPTSGDTTSAVPALSASEILALSKIEYNELEKRCFGSKHATCVTLKSDDFKDLWKLSKSQCDVAKSMAAMGGNKPKDECKKFYD